MTLKKCQRNKVILDGEYQIKEIKGKYQKSCTKYKRIIKYRNLNIRGNYTIVEGIPIKCYEKYFGETEYKETTEDLRGFRYLALINSSTNKDICFMQTYGKHTKWLVAKSNNYKDWAWLPKEEAFIEFFKCLKEKYGIDFIVINSEFLI